jgi:hypothetical protein
MIVKISDACFANGKYFLPVNHFETPIFFYGLHIDSLKTLDVVRRRDIVDVGAYIGDSALIHCRSIPTDAFSPSNLCRKTIA